MKGHADENSSMNLIKMPAELVLKFVLPHLGASDLKHLTNVCSYLNDIVQLFIQTFNTAVDLSTSCTLDQVTFMTNTALKLVTLDLSGCLNSPRLRNQPLDLKNVILMNRNLEKVFIPNTWISADIVEALARDAAKLKTVKLSTFKIRLYDLPDGTSRKLWPCSCWGTEMKLEQDFQFGQYFLPETLWRPRGENKIKETEERKLLNNLRMLKKNLDFQDFAWMSISDQKDKTLGGVYPKLVKKKDRNLMDPLDYHEYKCRSGMFYDENNDQDDFGLALFDGLPDYFDALPVHHH